MHGCFSSEKVVKGRLVGALLKVMLLKTRASSGSSSGYSFGGSEDTSGSVSFNGVRFSWGCSRSPATSSTSSKVSGSGAGSVLSPASLISSSIISYN